TAGQVGGVAQTPLTGSETGVSPTGNANPGPALTGTQWNATHNNLSSTPRRRLGDLVTPVREDGTLDPNGKFLRPGASTIYREQGKRFIAVKFSVRGRDLGGTVAEAKEKTAPLFHAPYRAEWSGEFQEMEEAEARLLVIIPLSLGLILVFLYLAFKALLDVAVVLSNVVALSLGGIWALYLTHTNFSISAAVGFISIFGVAIMDGLLSVAYFNSLRAQGVALREAILQGAGKRVRSMRMPALTAIFGLLPAAPPTRNGGRARRAAGGRGGGGDGDDGAAQRLPEAGVVQLLRPRRAAGVGGRGGALTRRAISANCFHRHCAGDPALRSAGLPGGNPTSIPPRLRPASR